MSFSEPVLTGPHAGRTVSHESGSSAELKLAGEQAGGDWAVVEWRVRAGDEPPIHTHTREDETLYVLDGSITAFVGDQRIEVKAGSYAALPKDVPHGLTVHGDEARLLVTVEPAGAEYFFVPRDDGDADPGRFSIVLHGPAATSLTARWEGRRSRWQRPSRQPSRAAPAKTPADRRVAVVRSRAGGGSATEPSGYRRDQLSCPESWRALIWKTLMADRHPASRD